MFTDVRSFLDFVLKTTSKENMGNYRENIRLLPKIEGTSDNEMWEIAESVDAVYLEYVDVIDDTVRYSIRFTEDEEKDIFTMDEMDDVPDFWKDVYIPNKQFHNLNELYGYIFYMALVAGNPEILEEFDFGLVEEMKLGRIVHKEYGLISKNTDNRFKFEDMEFHITEDGKFDIRCPARDIDGRLIKGEEGKSITLSIIEEAKREKQMINPVLSPNEVIKLQDTSFEKQVEEDLQGKSIIEDDKTI